MARNQANETFALTSFLYGGNADYIEDLHARYETDPSSVPAEWSDFFKELKDDRDDVIKSAEGPSWERANWPIAANGDLVSALDGDCARASAGVSINAADAASSWRRAIIYAVLLQADKR